MPSQTNEIRLTIEDEAGGRAEHVTTPRPVDQFGYTKWAEPALGINSIQADPIAFGLYGAIRALRRTGVLDTETPMLSLMERVVSIDFGDDEEGEPDPTSPAPSNE